LYPCEPTQFLASLGPPGFEKKISTPNNQGPPSEGIYWGRIFFPKKLLRPPGYNLTLRWRKERTRRTIPLRDLQTSKTFRHAKITTFPPYAPILGDPA
jgi:hypothetical protein